MRLKSLALALSVAAACGATNTPRAQTAPAKIDPMNVLISQGKYWQAHRRGDLAEQAWRKVLGIDPNQPDALYGMGIVLADRKNVGEAQQYLEHLRQVAPNYPELDELARRLGIFSPRDQAVNEARRLAQSGQNTAAAQEYQRALTGKPASAELQLEYYEALAATPQGWDEARRGLEQLAREHTDDPRYALAYAQHLTYRDATRREGIARLEKLANDATTGEAARRSWRQALLWLGARASDAALYQDYLRIAGDDVAVKARYESMVEQDKEARTRAQQAAAASAHGRAIADAFDALNRGDLESAKRQFTTILSKSPEDPDALGGMGIVALKQERFAEARNDLERASARSANPARWKSSLQSATYWSYTSEAIGARSNGEYAKAKTLFERAIALDPSDVTAQVLLADMLLANRDASGAEQAYRMALRRQADNPDAIRGLIGALAAQGRASEALALASKLTTEQQAKAGGIDRLRGTVEAGQARAAEARGDLGTARSLFEDALASNPTDPWLRLDLARIYVREGALGNARSMMDGLLATNPDMPDAIYASALLAAETHDWSKGLALLEKVPAKQRTDAMATLQHRLWVHQQAELAAQLAREGRPQDAAATLRSALPVAGGNAELIGAIATGYLQIGDAGQALALVRDAAQAAPGSADVLLQYAGIALAARQDAERDDVMRRLAAMPLTAAQHADLDKLNIAIVVQRTDAVRERGDLAGAYDVMSPWLAAMPDEPDLQAALGRLYSSAGDDANALANYRAALARRPDDQGLLLAAIGAASGVKQFDYAKSLARKALNAAPNDPQTLAAVGRMYRAEGDLSHAALYLRRSLIAANSSAGNQAGRADRFSNVPRNWQIAMQRIGTAPLPGTNPFVGKTPVAGAAQSTSLDADASADANGGARSALPTLPTFLSPSSPRQNVPYYPPVSQPASQPGLEPAPYVAPYNAPTAAPAGGYGPEMYGAAESGAVGAAPYVGVPDGYAPTPWPMSPAAQDAQMAQAYPAGAPYGQGMPARTQEVQRGNKKTAARKSAGSAANGTTRGAYARGNGMPAGYAPQPYYGQPSYPQQQPAYAQQPYPYAPQPAYARQPQYAQQQAYAQQPDYGQPYPRQSAYRQQPQPYTPYAPYAPAPQPVYAAQQPYVPQPPYPVQSQQAYVPQPPAGYGQPYYAQQAVPRGYADEMGADANVDSATGASSQTTSVAKELADIDRERASTVSGGVVFRNRDGEDGLSNLTDIEAPIQGRIKAGNGHIVVTATPVLLDAGTVAGTANAIARFGTGGAKYTPSTYGAQNASGVGLSIGYESRSWSGDAGVTPLGFVEMNAIGGLKYRGAVTDKLTYSLEVARRAVTDSMLSYAGTRYFDPNSGSTVKWGGVTSNGGLAALNWDDGTNGAYVNASYQFFHGDNVASNNALKGGGGFYSRVYKDANQTLTIGANTTLMRYAKDLSYYTYGQGGYFSPQQYIILNFPVEWTGRNGNFTYDLLGSVGVQHFRNKGSNYFVLSDNASVQGKADDTNAPDSQLTYPGTSKTGLAYSLKAEAEYRFAPQLSLGATASLGNAYQYREWIAAVYLRYSFTKEMGLQPFPPRPLTSPYLSLSE
ncbi:cellulose synthase subunit BcsC-related outer membrane protein [Trinickia sp. EG282A]|uniref:cellulose synthase subunit BcsC-related outer membrane protein n=1 Tax=Trinickia sp. EG282A TaxID=3237013 RepID=UPI0034D1FF02